MCYGSLIPSLLKSRMKVRGYSGGAHGRAPLHAQSIPSLSRIGISRYQLQSSSLVAPNQYMNDQSPLGQMRVELILPRYVPGSQWWVVTAMSNC